MGTEQREEARKKRRRRTDKHKAWRQEAIAYWSTRVCESDIGCDWNEADIRCWRCGCMRECQKCHIIPRSLGGLDFTPNLIPLCAMCHDEMPNVLDASAIWLWIKSDHGVMHDTYWVMRGMKESGLTLKQVARIKPRKLNQTLSRAGFHFGQNAGGIRLTTATLAWVFSTAWKESMTKKQILNATEARDGD